MLTKAATQAYKLIAISLPPDVRNEEINRLKSQCREIGLDFASRVDLRPRSQNDLVGALRRLRRGSRLLLSRRNKDSTNAAKDRRVDLLNFPQ